MTGTREDSGQIVPWFSHLEWIEAAKLIYSENSIDRSKGLHIIRLWKARCDALPTGVETTMVLLCALEGHRLSASVDDLSHRLALSAALTRFLNHALIAGQSSKDAFGQTMFEKAKSADIPGWVVKLRHEASHGKTVPALESLLEAANFSLDWLRWNYWDEEPIDWVIQEAPLLELIDQWEALGACLQAGYRKISSLPDEDLRKRNQGIRTVTEAISLAEQKIMSSSLENPEQLVTAVLLSQTFLSPPPGLYGKEELPIALISQWRPLLCAIHAARLLPRLVVKLHEKNSRLASLWVNYLLDVIPKLQVAQKSLRASGVVFKEVSSLAKFLQKKTESNPELNIEIAAREEVDLDKEWPLFVAAPSQEEIKIMSVEVAAKPNKNGRIYLDKLLNLANTEIGAKGKISQLWRIFLDEHPGSEGEGDIKTIEDLLQKAPVLKKSEKWIRLDDWNAKALGLLPWQEGTVELELDFERWE